MFLSALKITADLSGCSISHSLIIFLISCLSIFGWEPHKLQGMIGKFLSIAYAYISSSLQRNKFTHSLKRRYIETKTDVEDQKNLCLSCQIHGCNQFCMRCKSGKAK